MPMDQWQAEAFACIRAAVLGEPVTPLAREAFVVRVAAARAWLKGVVWKLIDPLREALALRTALLTHAQPYPGLEAEVQALTGPGFLVRTPWPQLAHLPRYLRAMTHRADRWRHDPGKDHRRAQTVEAWRRTLAAEAKTGARNAGHARQLDELRWLIEEYRVSVFAQDLGTAQPVSEKKLEHKLAAVRAAAKERPGPVPAPPPSGAHAPPAVKAPGPPAAKPQRLTNLSDLGRLLNR